MKHYCKLTEDPMKNICTFKIGDGICGKAFINNNQLNNHKTLCSHKKKKTRRNANNENNDVSTNMNEGDIQSPKKKAKTETKRIPNNTRVCVWFSDKKKYFVGAIADHKLKDNYEIKWDDERAKKHEIVCLKRENETTDPENEERWSILD
jgi:hypothetical protein